MKSAEQYFLFNLDGLSAETGFFAKTQGHKMDDIPEYSLGNAFSEHPVSHVAWLWWKYMGMQSMGFEDIATLGVMQYSKYSINSPDIIPTSHAVTLTKQRNITKYTQKLLENTNAFPLIYSDGDSPDNIEDKFGVFVVKDTFIGNEVQYDYHFTELMMMNRVKQYWNVLILPHFPTRKHIGIGISNTIAIKKL